AALLAAACATPPPPAQERGPLGVIDNVLSHEGILPSASPHVTALLADPLHAADAAEIFDRETPPALARLASAPAPEGRPVPLLEAMLPFLDALAEAQRFLKEAVPPLADVPASLPAEESQRKIAARVDRARLDRAAAIVLEATAQLLARPIAFPERAVRYDRGTDIVVIVGSPGDDTHELAPVREGSVRVVLDPGGNDRYAGTDVAIGGIAVILDLGGNDRYESTGASWGAAVGGISLLYDAGGDDEYVSGAFGQGAALGGIGILLDLAGNDRYRVEAFGQGLGLAKGTGLLWDRAGDDHYEAAGLPDPFERGGRLSYAQGAAVGVRTGTAGGTGILRDDAGDDTCVAQLYAQGAAYYWGLGLLWDRDGNDRYDAARYAQGAGVHQAVGVLRDERGDDAYALSVGVGQGIGVDLAVGALVDAAGDDRYRAPTLAQGAATANGVGLFDDRAGHDDARLAQPPGRGVAEWSRGLPSVAWVLGQPLRVGEPPAEASDAPIDCPAESKAPPADLPLAEALRRFGPELAADRVTPALYARLMSTLRASTAESLASLPSEDFDVLWPLATALRCALKGATPAQAKAMWDAFEQALDADPASPYAGLIAFALRERPPPEPQRQRLLARIAAHPSCSVRSAGLRLDGSVAAAQAALESSCWQLQAQALRLLEARDAAPADLSRVPAFLRPASARASRPAP
ncbi:MAG TPA: hypothetical protein VFV84_12805, partial [Burkholderiales bacterium]|nr:hypothetical protein [Burkholderiales bacterium]